VRRTLKVDESSARATPQMGSEATIRYLKARLVVMEEELSEAGKASSEREVKLKEIELRNKQLEEDKVRARAHTHTHTHTHIHTHTHPH
jgi:hypothetical protein